jgi:hypothetical protein
MVRRGARLGAAFAILALAGCGPSGRNQATAPATAVKAPPSADAASAEAFLGGLYGNGHYPPGQQSGFQMFDADAAEVFDPTVLKLLAEDRKVTRGEVGVIDGDWLCDCQDYSDLRPTITVRSASPSAASAFSEVKDVGEPTRHIEFQLIKTPVGWRIHDIKDEDQPWLTQALTNEIKAPKSGDGDD